MPEYSSYADYRAAARGFMGGGKQDGVIEGIRSNGDLLRVDPRTGRFGIRSREGVILTYFRPINQDDKSDKDYPSSYFREEVAK